MNSKLMDVSKMSNQDNKISSKELFHGGQEPYDMLDYAPINIMYCDLDFKITYINPKSFETLSKIQYLLPIPVSQIIGNTIDVFHRNPAHQRKILSSEKNLPFKSIFKLGEEYLDLLAVGIYKDGVYSGVMVTWDIVTEKVKSDATTEALSKSQACIEFNPDGTIFNANTNFLNGLGYENLNEIKGRHHRIFCDEKYANSSAYEQFWEKLRSGQFDAGQYPRITKSGKTIWIQATYNPVMDKDGKVFKVIKYATDITKQKEIQIEMVKTLTDLATQVASASEELSATATQLTKNAQLTTEQASSAAAGTEELSVGMKTVAGSTLEMTNSIREITKSTNSAASMSNDSQRKAQETNKIINQLGTSSNEIGTVVKVISSIAQQTNLLALNATIEAARAGDAGKGFAVVANEVKELAKQTAKATEDISSKITSIQKDTGSAVGAISEITKAIEGLNNISMSISAAVEEQNATTNELSRIINESTSAVTDVSKGIRDVSQGAMEATNAASQTLAAAKDLSRLADQLSQLVKKIEI